MRMQYLMLLALGSVHMAAAHPLDADTGLIEQLGHQLFSTHHLPLLLVAAVGLTVVVRRLLGNGRR